MDITIEQIKLIFEIIYFLSGPIIIFIVILGFRQLKFTRENAEIASKRESYSLASEQCKYYLEKIIPLQNKLDKAIEKNKLNFDKLKLSINKRKIDIKYDRKIYLEEIKKVLSEVNDVMNHLESFSLFFTSKIAEEKIAFKILGVTFCSNLKILLPLILHFNKKQRDYISIMSLFFIWNERLRKKGTILY